MNKQNNKIFIENKKKDQIIKQIKNISYEEATEDIKNFFEIKCKNINSRSLMGLKYLNYWFFKKLIETKTKMGLTFFDLRKKIFNTQSFQTFLDFYNKSEININIEYIMYRYFSLYFMSNNMFRPVIAKSLYCKFKPNTILDFSCGWGGRMLGAIALDNIKYIGFDTNKSLKPIYKKIIKDLNIEERVNIFFKDSSKVDFSKFDYDFIFTSPPYFNKEIYEHMPNYENKIDFLNKFYIPVITNVFKYLKNNGVMALNIPLDIYNIHKKVFIPCNKKIKLNINKRNLKKKNLSKKDYEEFIYIWYK